MDKKALTREATRVLKLNDLGKSTRPTAKLYPHQWLWDSAFIAIGLRHKNVARAQTEIRSLMAAQWKNGMIPYIVFGAAKEYHAGPNFWQSHVSPNCPKNIQSTGGTQPAMIAEAVVRIGESMNAKDRLTWYREIYPQLAAYHEWMYRDRDPDGSGLVVLFHPWETGLDNNPQWMSVIHAYALSWRLKLMDKSRALTKFMERFRRDTTIVPAHERMSTLELLAFYDVAKDMRKLKYDDARMIKEHKLVIQDVGFNAILVRANAHLAAIAHAIGEQLPPLTLKAHRRGVKVLDVLWDEASGYYYSRDYRNGTLITVPSVSCLLPLYAGTLPVKRTRRLIRHLQNPDEFGAQYLVPSVPLNSPYFKPHCYWQGSSWINIAWLLSIGLLQNGQKTLANKLVADSLSLIEKKGMYEYFSPLDGQPAGAPNFSWTASLTLQMLHEQS